MEITIVDGLWLGLQTALQPEVLLYCFFGVFLGTLVGVLPGIGALATISLLLPITYHLPPIGAVVMLAGVFYGAQYGGSTASILLNLPGHAAAVVACLDGYPLAKQGKAGIALFITTIASFIGSLLGILALVLFSPFISELGLKFGPAEYFSMMVLGLIAASSISSGSPLKGLASMVLGLILGTVGTDVNSGITRFDFSIPELMDGISLVALAMGLFGISEIIISTSNSRSTSIQGKVTLKSMLPSKAESKRAAFPILRGSGIGAFFGAIPGTGPAISSFMAYMVEKQVSSDQSRFGQGAIEGVAAPEAANNAAAQTGFVPTLSLGIPGDAVMALMLGALIIHGIQPGPMLITEQPELFWGLIASFGVGNLLLLVLNIPLIGVWISILRIPYHYLFPAIIVFIGLGAFSVNNNTFDILLVALIGSVGYLLSILRFEPAPLLLGFVLGPLMEENLRRTLLISRGDPMVFIQRPLSMTFLIIAFFVIVYSVIRIARSTLQSRV